MDNLIIYDKENNVNRLSDNGLDYISQELSLDAYENTLNDVIEDIELLKILHNIKDRTLKITFYVIAIKTSRTIKYRLKLSDNELVVIERKEKILKIQERCQI